MKRVLLVVSAFFMVLASTVSFSESTSGGFLLGKWNHVEMVHTADGRVVRVQESHGESSVEYKQDGTWAMRSPRNSNSGTYKLMNGNSLETTILQSDIPTQLGWRSVKQIEVDGTTLKVITKYDEKAMEVFAPGSDGTRPKEMSVTSTFKRVGEK